MRRKVTRKHGGRGSCGRGLRRAGGGLRRAGGGLRRAGGRRKKLTKADRRRRRKKTWRFVHNMLKKHKVASRGLKALSGTSLGSKYANQLRYMSDKASQYGYGY